VKAAQRGSTGPTAAQDVIICCLQNESAVLAMERWAKTHCFLFSLALVATHRKQKDSYFGCSGLKI